MYIKCFIISLFFTGFVNAQTYYCDPVNGDNNNNGSQITPFSSFGSVNWTNVGLQDNVTIYLLDGEHGNGFLINQHFTTNLLVKSINVHQAVLTKIQINNCTNITFEDIKIDASLGSFSKEEPIFNGDTNASHITLNNCLIQAATDSSTWTKTDWYTYTASGIQMRGNNITLTNNTFLNLYHAVELRGDYCLMQNNTVLNFAGDAIRGLGSYCTYENNIIKNCFINDYDIQHDDAFQVYDVGGIVSNIIFRNNKIIIFENPSQFVLDNDLIGSLMQGVIITDGNAESWIVENNLVINDHYHGITLYGARNCRIQNNTVIQSHLFTDIDEIPRILVDDQNKVGGRTNANNIIRNNICAQYTPWTYDTTSTIENNVDINQFNYDNYSYYFLDYPIGDYHLKSSSIAVNFGVNSNLYATDLDGNNRVYNNGTVDAGCYEFQGDADTPIAGEYEIISTSDGIISSLEQVSTNNPYLNGTGSGAPLESTLWIGGRDANNNGNTTSAILPFRLPERPSESSVIEASLVVNLHYVKEWINSNIDLYGLPYKTTNTLNPDDHYDDDYTTSHETDTAIQNDFIIREEETGTAYTLDRIVQTSTTANTALITYINAQYDNGASEGDFIFLRLNIDVPINQSSTTSLPTAASHYYGISDESTGLNAPRLNLKISNSLTITEEKIKQNTFLVYPNPLNIQNGNIFIKSTLLKKKSQLSIYNTFGNLVASFSIKKRNSKSYQTKLNLNKGIYFLKLKNEVSLQTQKLIIR